MDVYAYDILSMCAERALLPDGDVHIASNPEHGSARRSAGGSPNEAEGGIREHRVLEYAALRPDY